VLEESRYIQWNEELREKLMQIWQRNCSAASFIELKPLAPSKLPFNRQIRLEADETLVSFQTSLDSMAWGSGWGRMRM
jgi:hypothetical protein